MKKLKKPLKISAIVLLALIGILLAAPLLFKKQLAELVKEEINQNLKARVNFTDIDLSFFRRFPRVSLSINNIEVIGVDEFSKDTLISAKEINVALNIMSVIKGSGMKIYAVSIDQPRIHAIVKKDGKANWDIAKADSTEAAATGEEAPFSISLQKYEIRNGYINYVDEPGNMSSEILNLNHRGSGDFTSELFTLDTRTTADAVSFVYGGIPYLASTKTSIDADIEVDNKSSKYSFRTDEIVLNELKLATEGFFQLVNDSTYNMDIAFKAPSTEFKDILSLVPAVYKQDFDKVKTSGKAVFNGFVKGTYSSTQIPAYHLNLDIKEGFFQYPDLPKPVKHINLTVNIDNPDGVTDNTVVDISKAHIEFDKDPFDFRLLLKKPLTDRYIDAAAKGRLDLSQLTQFIKLEPSTKLAGLLDADVQAKGNLAVVQQQKPGPFSAKGFLDLSKLYYASKDFPQPIQNTNAHIQIDNPDGVADHTVVNIPAAHIEIGKDVVDMNLLLKTPASDPDFAGAAKANFNLANLSQFYSLPAGTTLSGLLNAAISFKGKKSMIDKSQYEAIQLTGTTALSNLKYASKEYPDGANIKDLLLTFNPKNVILNEVKGQFMQTEFEGKGRFDNLIGFMLKDESLKGNLDLHAGKVDLNKWMGTSESTADSSSASSSPFAVPKNIDFVLNTDIDQVKYDKVLYDNVMGTLLIKNETVQLKNIQMQALDGSIGLNGSYSTAISKKEPDISLSYDVKDLDVEKTFRAFNTVQKLMPIAQFISGKLNSQLTMKGKLGADMMPDLSSLTGNGNLLLIQGFLSKFKPLEQMAQTLQIKELEKVSVKDIKNYIEFANGKVLVKPFKVKVKDIDMEIGGMHGFDQSMDYTLNMKVPRAMMGEKGNQLVNGMVQQVSNKGVPIKVSDMIPLQVKMGGSITNPLIKTDLKQTTSNLAEDLKQQTTDFAKQKIDSTKQAATKATRDSVESAKKQIVAGLNDELKKQLAGKKDSGNATAGTSDTKKKLEETGKGLINNLLRKKKPASDTTGKNK